jgi:hypothetical protein
MFHALIGAVCSDVTTVAEKTQPIIRARESRIKVRFVALLGEIDSRFRKRLYALMLGALLLCVLTATAVDNYRRRPAGRLPIGTRRTEWESATSGRLEPVRLNFPQAVLEVTALAVVRDQFQCP